MITTNEAGWHKITLDTFWPPDFFRGNSVEVVTPSCHLRTMLYEPPDSDWIKERARDGCWFRSLYLPAPPKEQTQRERDEAAYSEWYNSTASSRYHDAREQAFHAALAWERAEIAKLISETIPATWSKELSYYIPNSIIEKLRARLRP